MNVRRFVALSLIAFISLSAKRARAEDGCLLLRSGEVDATVSREVLDHLRRSLERRNIAVCTSDAANPAAILDVVPGEGTFTLTLRIDDGSTSKTTARELDVSPIPPDGRPLAVAQAADELLRASWPERFVDTPPPARPPISPIEPPPAAPEVPPAALGRVHVALGVGAELFSSGHAQLGPDLDVTFAPLPWLGVGVRGGMRASGSRSAAHGEHATSVLLGSVGIAYRAALERRVGLDVGPRIHLMRFSFETTPSAGFVARDGAAAAAVCATLEARSWLVPIEPLHVGVALSIGAPLRDARAIAGGVRVHEIGGLLAGTQLFAGLVW